jgi:hypothetical protein
VAGVLSGLSRTPPQEIEKTLLWRYSVGIVKLHSVQASEDEGVMLRA